MMWKTATFTPGRTHRLTLRRWWAQEPWPLILGLKACSADETNDSPDIISDMQMAHTIRATGFVKVCVSDRIGDDPSLPLVSEENHGIIRGILSTPMSCAIINFRANEVTDEILPAVKEAITEVANFAQIVFRRGEGNRFARIR